MKRMVLCIALLFAATPCRDAFAGEQAPRIGVVRIQEVFKRYQYAVDMEKKIKEAFQTDEDEISALKKKIDEAKDRVRHDPLLEPNSLKARLLMLEIQKDQIVLEDKLNRFKQNTRKHMAEFYRNIYTDFRRNVDAFAKQYAYDLIITAPDRELSEESKDSDSPMALQNEILLRSVQYISPRADITEALLKTMNNEYARRQNAGGQR